jgi:hypothetical protein
MNKFLNTAKNIVVANKVTIAVVATTVICIAINRRAINQHNEFLTEKGLLEEFYALED